MMRGCESVYVQNKLPKLQKKYSFLQKKQQEIAAELRRQRKQIELEQHGYIIRTIQILGLPIDNPAIIIGALICAKENVDDNNLEAINNYIAKYTAFAKANEETTENIATDSDVIPDENS